MIKNILLSCVLLLSAQVLYSQVGIGTSNPDSSSILDVSSTDKGVLFPRMTTVQRNAIVNPANGLTIYNLNKKCLDVNRGTSSNPDWYCLGGSSPGSVVNNCNLNGFEGSYFNGRALTASNKFSVTIRNNSSNPSTIGFSTSDLVLSGVSGVSVNSVSPASATIASGGSQVVEYTLTGTPSSIGVLTGVWTNLGLNCTKTVNVISGTIGSATFALPQTVIVVSFRDGTPLVELQGVIDNTNNKFTVAIPYTSGSGNYDAYTGVYTPNNTGASEGGDTNSFRLTYPAGAFSSSGSIIATIEVDGDGSFNAKKQLFGIQSTIAALDFQVNGISKGDVNLDVIGGIPDRNFADPNHKFIYLPVTSPYNGRVWLNHNLGADYSNINHSQFNPSKRATSRNDHHAYGSLFQWGRYSDGHELINHTSSTTQTVVNGFTPHDSTSDTPPNSLFIANIELPHNWRVPTNINLWQGESGINNPCPQGYRLPTDNELSGAVQDVQGITDVSAAAGFLALTNAGTRDGGGGWVAYTGGASFYWTSTIVFHSDGGNLVYEPRYRTYNSHYTQSSIGRPIAGLSVRCIKN